MVGILKQVPKMALNADAAAASKVILQYSLQHNFPVEINENVNADVGDDEGVKKYRYFYFSLLWLVGNANWAQSPPDEIEMRLLFGQFGILDQIFGFDFSPDWDVQL